jgi:anti-anti-sigma regulatory factor
VLNITVSHKNGRVPVAVMKLEGELDAASYLDVIARARELAAQGTSHVLLDLGDLTYMGSSGLFAIHSVAMLLRGAEPPDPEHGWGAIHSVDSGGSEQVQPLKLLNPQPAVDRVLERSGLKRYFETYTDRAAAIASF